MTPATLKFTADLQKFADKVGASAAAVAADAAKSVHAQLQDATPYRTGRARASWNIGVGEPDGTPAPPLEGASIGAANTFYDGIADAKRRFVVPTGAGSVSVGNGLHYIEALNDGRSPQAPPGFFQAVVAGAEMAVERAVEKLRK